MQLAKNEEIKVGFFPKMKKAIAYDSINYLSIEGETNVLYNAILSWITDKTNVPKMNYLINVKEVRG